MHTKEEIYKMLDEANIPYETLEHKAVFTIDEMKGIDGINIEDVCKNLFLRDDSGKRHFLVVLREDKTADLKSVRAQIGSSRLGFASEDRLMKHMGLTKGAVTPLGMLNDESASVEVFFDEDLRGREHLGVHPCDNTATVWLSCDSLEKIMALRGKTIKYIKI
ncbi:MAG: prolyl-tRNA synthetase associated domain-containing protein [Synergistaceae bacterium]|nr:prolyl-tRNA synthetase associated domain-containing protein [Synergistaceae bacterium]